MGKIGNNDLIDIYYDLFDYYQEDELVINAIYSILRRNNRHTIKSIIRKDLQTLNLSRYEKVLVELSGYCKNELDDFKLDNLSNLNIILNILNNLDQYEGRIVLQNKKLVEIGVICQKLLRKS